MKNFQFHFRPAEKQDVLTILQQYNDIIVDHVSDDEIGFTIELDNDAADVLYTALQDEVKMKVGSSHKQII